MENFIYFYITTRELLYISCATCLSSTLFFLYGRFTNVASPESIYFNYTCLVLLLLILSRFSYKFVNRILSKFLKSYSALKGHLNGIEKNRVLLIGSVRDKVKLNEIFVLDMGQPVKILDLTLNFIRLSGFEPYKDIDITFTGLRPGEKLFEELLMDEEGMTETSSKKIFIGKPSDITFNELSESLNYLHNALKSDCDLREALHHVVPTYRISPNGCTELTPKQDMEESAS